jgi:splicing factor 3A subunit 2
MSAFEQKTEAADKAWQYVVLACDPYETIAFKIPNAPIDTAPGKVVSQFDTSTGQFSLRFYFV